MTLHFAKHKIRSNGVTTEFVRVFLEEGGKSDWVGEIEPAKGVFRARFHQSFTPDLLRAILAKWEEGAAA